MGEIGTVRLHVEFYSNGELFRPSYYVKLCMMEFFLREKFTIQYTIKFCRKASRHGFISLNDLSQYLHQFNQLLYCHKRRKYKANHNTDDPPQQESTLLRSFMFAVQPRDLCDL